MKVISFPTRKDRERLLTTLYYTAFAVMLENRARQLHPTSAANSTQLEAVLADVLASSNNPDNVQVTVAYHNGIVVPFIMNVPCYTYQQMCHSLHMMRVLTDSELAFALSLENEDEDDSDD